MSVESGQRGDLTWLGSQVTKVLNWKYTRTSENHAFHTNESAGSRERIAGVKDCSGTFETLELPTFDEGAKRQAVLYDDVNIHTGTIIIDSIDETCDIDGGAPNKWVIAFSGSGAFAKTTGSSP